MEKSNVAVEESHSRNESPASASKSLGSLVHINSIAIDLSCAMEEIESPVHEHFSIRGFVAGMRKKDWKECLPFASQNINDDLVDNLPPLAVPKFRRWQCSNCVTDTTAGSTELKMLHAERGDAGTSFGQHVVGRGKDVLFSHGIRNIGDGHVSRQSVDGVYNDPIRKMTDADPHCKGNNTHNMSAGNKEKTHVKNNNCGTSSAHITEANPVRIGKRHDNNADASHTVWIAENTSIRIDEPDNVSSGIDAVVCALPRKRKPKLRSLADIMEEENNSTSEHIKMRSALSSEMLVTSTEKEDDLQCHSGQEASAEVVTVARTPHRKRKIEDRGSLQATNSFGTGKRFKGPIPDSGKRRLILVEVSDSESGGDDSAQSELQLISKTRQIIQKRNKALEISKKMKQTQSGNKAVLGREVPKIGYMLPESLEKHAASVETSFGNMEHVSSSPRGEMEPYLSSLIPGKQVDKISVKSKSKRAAIEVDPNPVIHPNKSFIGDCSVQGKVVLDLSLNSYKDDDRNTNNQISFRQRRSIPDLNESLTKKPSTSQWKQLITPENRCSALHKNLEMNISCSKQMTGEGRRQFIVSEPQAVKIHSNVEPGGNTDDIPMDIVELLARNQLERTLENSRNHLLSSTANTSFRGSRAIYADGRPSIIDFPLSNARKGISVPGGEESMGQGIISYPQVKNRQLENSIMEENQFRIFSSFKPCQPKRSQYSASNSLFSGPRASERADVLWPPRRKNVPFHIDISQNRSIQHNGFDMQSFPDQNYKGKIISDMKGEVRKAARDASAAKEGRIGSSTKSTLDAYSNDTIPAMQLLSLMDRGIVSGSSFKVGSNSYLDKPFSPCNHHPRLNVNEKHSDPFLNGSFFSQRSHNKDFPSLLNGVRFLGESSKKSYTRGHMPPPQGNTKAFNLDGLTHPSSGKLELEVCTINRNPADFSIPDAKNEYTISARDLKSRKRTPLKERSRAVNLEGLTRVRARKDASGKVCSRK